MASVRAKKAMRGEAGGGERGRGTAASPMRNPRPDAVPIHPHKLAAVFAPTFSN